MPTSPLTPRVAALTLLLLGTAAGCARPGRSAPLATEDDDRVDGALGARADSALRAFAREGFSGAALVAVGGRVVLAKGYGLADRATGRLNRSTTMFELASLTKTFTAAAVLLLEADGRLRTDDPASRFLGPMPGVKGGATIHHLATHTAGLVVANTEIYAGPDRTAFVEALKATPAESPPGERYRYTNAGYSALAVVVEVAAGDSFESFLRRRLFARAGLTHTAFDGELALGDPRRATHYVAAQAGAAAEPRAVPPDPYVWGVRGASGLVSNVWDLYRWHRALHGAAAGGAGGVLPPSAARKMFTRFGEESYGWHVDTGAVRPIIQKGGGLQYTATQILYFPTHDAVVIWVNNDTRRSWRRTLNEALTAIVADRTAR